VVVKVTSLCDNPIDVAYVTGRHASTESPQSGRYSYDARGNEAAVGDDYTAASGSFTVSSSLPASFRIALVNDSIAEPEEHVLVDLDTPTGTAAFAGDRWVCGSAPGDGGPVVVHSAFTIIDDDAAPATRGGPTASAATGPSSRASAASTTSPAKSTATTARTDAATAKLTAKPTTTTAAAAKADDSLREADGLELVGSAAPTTHAVDANRRSTPMPLKVAATLLVGTSALGFVLLLRRRGSHW
jgi:hypothetical protein